MSIRFTNQNRANRYCTYEYASTDDVTGVYSAVVAAGVYDIIVERYYDSEAASATHYVTGQSLTASRTGYDFSLPLYKVSLVSSNADISDSIRYKRWYINDERAGYGSTLYLKAGNYMLISDSESGDRNETNSGSWFDGLTKTISYSEANLTASVNVANKAVQTTVRKVTAGTSSSSVYRYPAAKNTNSHIYVDDGGYSLPWEDYTCDGDYWDEVQTALKLEITEAGTYRLGSDYGYVKLFNSNGQVVEPSDGSYEKTYENLPTGTYFVGTGDYSLEDYSVYVNSVSEENTSSAVESSAAEDTDALRDDIAEENDDTETIAPEESSVSEGIAVE